MRTLKFTLYPWKQDAINSLVESLSANESITELNLDNFNWTLPFMEGLVKILKRNKYIKRLVIQKQFGSFFAMSKDTWARFCDGLEYYNIHTLELGCFNFDERRLNDFNNGIKYNQSIKSLIFTYEVFSGQTFENLCNMLAFNPTIEELQLIRCFNRYGHQYTHFKQVLKANYLKKLTINNSYLNTGNFCMISKGLKHNKSITELNLPSNLLDWVELGKILLKNRSIKKLDLNDNQIANVADLKLAEISTLTELSVVNCRGLTSKLFGELCHNKTLKVLRFGFGNQEDENRLENLLNTTTTLRELEVHLFHASQSASRSLSNGLKLNKSIRKLSVNFFGRPFNNLAEFLDSLKTNLTLTELDLGELQNLATTNRPLLADVDDLILDLLKSNKTLRHIRGAEQFVALERNRLTQDTIIYNTCTFIKMILMKPNSFILPIEVWAEVFKYVSFSFVPFDFERYFKDLTKDS